MRWLKNILTPKKKPLKAVTLIDHRNGSKGILSVFRIKNSTKLYIDQELTRRQVNKLIRKGWQITIINEEVKI